MKIRLLFFFLVPILSLIGVAGEDVFVYMNDPRLIYSPGQWNFVIDNCEGKGYVTTTNFGATVSLSFVGYSVWVYYLVGTGGGISRIQLDQFTTKVDTCSFAPTDDPACGGNGWSSDVNFPLTHGPHNITVNLQKKSPNSNETGKWAYMDIFAIRYSFNANESSTTTTMPSPSATSHSATPLSKTALIGIIAGCAAAGFIILAGIIFLIWHRRQNSNTWTPPDANDPSRHDISTSPPASEYTYQAVSFSSAAEFDPYRQFPPPISLSPNVYAPLLRSNTPTSFHNQQNAGRQTQTSYYSQPPGSRSSSQAYRSEASTPRRTPSPSQNSHTRSLELPLGRQQMFQEMVDTDDAADDARTTGSRTLVHEDRAPSPHNRLSWLIEPRSRPHKLPS